MEKINTYVQFYKGDVELNISVKSDLTLQEGNLKNFGYFEITDGSLGKKSIFWDSVDFFLDCSKKEFKEVCKEQLEEAGYNWKEVYDTIQSLLKRAKKLKLITD
jgi:hypothetical protein